MVAKTWIIDDMPKGFFADLALSDARMPIDMRIQISLRIIQMKGHDLLHADQRIDLANGGVPSFGRANVVTGGKKMRRIQTNREAFRLFHTLEDHGQMPNLRAEATPLPRRILQRDAHR